MITQAPPVAIIAGPTASGKSALALALARRTDGVIINADSAQVYRDLWMVSARPTAEEMASVEHRLFGTRDAAVPCSAADWANEAATVVVEVLERGRLPILVGGTGLYLRTLLQGIAPVPAIPSPIRAEVRAASVAANHRRLTDHDPDAARRLHPADTTRVARALEVVLATGRTLASWQADRSGGIADRVAVSGLVLLPPRAWLQARCDARFAAMLKAGAREEVAALLARGLDPALPAMRAIGVPEIAALLRGQIDEQAAITRATLATRQYAKRQQTWFANQAPPEWVRFNERIDAPNALDRALAALDPNV
jgi:tRNA dimethylallyltransferase